ncbi:MAG: type II secretion system F family protein [Steroidobacteraceae bacterium]
MLLLLFAGVLSALALLRGMRAAGAWWTDAAGRVAEAELASLFVFVSSSRLLALSIVLAAGCAVVGLALHLPLPVLVAMVVPCLAMPRIIVRAIRARRRKRLVQQLPDTMAMWAGLLRAGQGVNQALSQVTERQAPPLGDELRLLLGQMRLGMPIEAAFVGLCGRVGSSDLRLLATLLATHRELGGNLAESLERLAELLRARLVMEDRIQALTAQGRMQGLVVGLLPLLVMAALYVMEPAAMRVLHTTWQGWCALATIAVLELTGFLLIRRIVRVDI